mmetsp:Transcript_23244/g.59373  ORF Transcript_23244/g.59373 Transcript_23244/m.59373 type:complete len:274 (+) Transcript_23244:97-918(+)|eukprot:689763-Prymnesium_polylepis.1
MNEAFRDTSASAIELVILRRRLLANRLSLPTEDRVSTPPLVRSPRPAVSITIGAGSRGTLQIKRVARLKRAVRPACTASKQQEGLRKAFATPGKLRTVNVCTGRGLLQIKRVQSSACSTGDCGRIAPNLDAAQAPAQSRMRDGPSVGTPSRGTQYGPGGGSPVRWWQPVQSIEEISSHPVLPIGRDPSPPTLRDKCISPRASCIPPAASLDGLACTVNLQVGSAGLLQIKRLPRASIAAAGSRSMSVPASMASHLHGIALQEKRRCSDLGLCV